MDYGGLELHIELHIDLPGSGQVLKQGGLLALGGQIPPQILL